MYRDLLDGPTTPEGSLTSSSVSSRASSLEHFTYGIAQGSQQQCYRPCVMHTLKDIEY